MCISKHLVYICASAHRDGTTWPLPPGPTMQMPAYGAILVLPANPVSVEANPAASLWDSKKPALHLSVRKIHPKPPHNRPKQSGSSKLRGRPKPKSLKSG